MANLAKHRFKKHLLASLTSKATDFLRFNLNVNTSRRRELVDAKINFFINFLVHFKKSYPMIFMLVSIKISRNEVIHSYKFFAQNCAKWLSCFFWPNP